jgi:hypothetical protein
MRSTVGPSLVEIPGQQPQNTTSQIQLLNVKITLEGCTAFLCRELAIRLFGWLKLVQVAQEDICGVGDVFSYHHFKLR